ncbi:MAG: hypothetical protein PWP37_1417 [Thermotogota bacterium]|nr:hypothetical protein [Thermotogota bacterium]MDK2865225.1 hypothetical protein [Thermotogota bacterium]
MENREKTTYEPIWKIRLKLFWRNFKKNWALFKERKSGLFGLYMIIAFGIFALLYPIVRPYLDASVYNPIIGTDPHVRDMSYIVDYMSPQNVMKGVEIPATKYLTYAILDQGEDFLDALRDVLDKGQKVFVGLDNAQAFRHVLDTLTGNYEPRKMRTRLQFELSSLLNTNIISPKAIAGVEELTDRSKFSLDNFGAVVEEVGLETLAKAFAGVEDERTVNRAALRVRALYGPEERDRFKTIVDENRGKVEGIRKSEEKVFEAVSRLAAEGLLDISLNIENQRAFETAVLNETLRTLDFVKIAAYPTLRDLATVLLAKKRAEEFESYLKSSSSPEVSSLADLFALSVQRVRENVEGSEETREFYVRSARDALNQEIKVLASYELLQAKSVDDLAVDQMVELVLGSAGRTLAITTFDFSSAARVDLLEALSRDAPKTFQAYKIETKALQEKVAEARFFIYATFSEAKDLGILDEIPQLPSGLLESDIVKIVQALDVPVGEIFAQALTDKEYESLKREFEITGDVNYRRMDFIDLLSKLRGRTAKFAKLVLPDADFSGFSQPVNYYKLQLMALRLLEDLGNEPVESLVEEQVKELLELANSLEKVGPGVEELKEVLNAFLDNKGAEDDLLMALYDFTMASPETLVLPVNAALEKVELDHQEARKELVSLYDYLSVRSLLGVSHPLPPSRWHWLGTDPNGRDIFIQLMYSTPSEFALGVLAAIITVTIGTIIGTVSAFYGGLVDNFFMRLADIMLLFPGIAFLIVLSGFMEMNLIKLAIVLGLLSGFGGITLVLKAQALTIKVKPFIEAARVAGGSNAYIIFNHIVPNVMPLSFLYMMFSVTSAVFSEAVLSFFGLLKIRMSWGIMINTVWSSGYLSSGQAIGTYWWLWLPAGAAITLLCSAFYFLGRGLEEIVNPRLRKR